METTGQTETVVRVRCPWCREEGRVTEIARGSVRAAAEEMVKHFWFGHRMTVLTMPDATAMVQEEMDTR